MEMWNWRVGRLLSKVVSAHAQSFMFFGLYCILQNIHLWIDPNLFTFSFKFDAQLKQEIIHDTYSPNQWEGTKYKTPNQFRT